MIQDSINQMLGTAAIATRLAGDKVREIRENTFATAEQSAKENVAQKNQYNKSLSELEAREVGLHKNSNEYKAIQAKKDELKKTYDAENMEKNINESFDKVQGLASKYDNAKLFNQGEGYYANRSANVYKQNWDATQSRDMAQFTNEMDKMKLAREKAMNRAKLAANAKQEQASSAFTATIGGQKVTDPVLLKKIQEQVEPKSEWDKQLRKVSNGMITEKDWNKEFPKGGKQ